MLNVGTIIGGMVMGYFSDMLYSRRSPVILVAMIISVIINFIVIFEYDNIVDGYFPIMLLLGFLINGFTNMIYANCSTDVGKDLEMKYTQSRVLASTVCIIESFGALGSALGIFIVGYTSREEVWGYQYGYWVLITLFITISIIPLSVVFVKDFSDIRLIIKNKRKF